MVEQSTAGRGNVWNPHVCVHVFVPSFIRLLLPSSFPLPRSLSLTVLADMGFVIQTKLTLNLCLSLPSAGMAGLCHHARLGARISRLNEKTL